MYRLTRSSNRNGNAGRPYYKCDPCNKFLVFADDRGNDPANPECDCGISSKKQISSRDKGRKIHFVCRMGGCDFYAPKVVRDGETVAAEGGLVAELAALKII